jgi:hypothetical protein
MNIFLGLLQAFIALSAMAGGFMFIKDPSGAGMGFEVSMLEGSFFPNYLIPGLFLFLVNGLGSLIGAVLSFIKNRQAGIVAIALGAILLAWIVVQVIIIREINWMHILYFALGLAELTLGVLVSQRQKRVAAV